MSKIRHDMCLLQLSYYFTPHISLYRRCFVFFIFILPKHFFVFIHFRVHNIFNLNYFIFLLLLLFLFFLRYLVCKMAAIGYQHFKLNTSSGGSVENRFEQGRKKKDCEKIKNFTCECTFMEKQFFALYSTSGFCFCFILKCQSSIITTLLVWCAVIFFYFVCFVSFTVFSTWGVGDKKNKTTKNKVLQRQKKARVWSDSFLCSFPAHIDFLRGCLCLTKLMAH